MSDRNTTLGGLTEDIIALCRRKGWGVNGLQNPQHVAMAMVVETLELLEHFENEGPFDENRVAEIAEEASDVMMYSLQLMRVIGFDVSAAFSDDFSDASTPISVLRDMAGTGGTGAAVAAMRIATHARYVLEYFQWMTGRQVDELFAGGFKDVRCEIGRAFADEFLHIMRLANILDYDISESVARKIAIVNKRVYPKDEPAR